MFMNMWSLRDTVFCMDIWLILKCSCYVGVAKMLTILCIYLSLCYIIYFLFPILLVCLLVSFCQFPKMPCTSFINILICFIPSFFIFYFFILCEGSSWINHVFFIPNCFLGFQIIASLPICTTLNMDVIVLLSNFFVIQ